VLRLASESLDRDADAGRYLRREAALDEFVRRLDLSLGVRRDDGWEGRVARGVLEGDGLRRGLLFTEALDALSAKHDLPSKRTEAALWACAAYAPGVGEIVALSGADDSARLALGKGSSFARRQEMNAIPPDGECKRTLKSLRVWDRPVRLLFIGDDRRSADIQEEFIHWTPFVEPRGLIVVDTSRRERDSTAGRRFVDDSLRGSREFEFVYHEQELLIVRKSADRRATI